MLLVLMMVTTLTVGSLAAKIKFHAISIKQFNEKMLIGK